MQWVEAGFAEQARAEGLAGCARGNTAHPDFLQAGPRICLLLLALPVALCHGLQMGPTVKPAILQERGSEEPTDVPLAYLWTDSYLSWLHSETCI